MAFFPLKSLEPCSSRFERIREEPLQLCTRLLCKSSAVCFTFRLRHILAASGCGRMMPEVLPRRTVPSELLNLTLGFTKRALCLRWQNALATDLEKVAKTACLVKKGEAGDVWAPSGTFHGTAVGAASQSLFPLVLHFFSLSPHYPSLFPSLGCTVIPSSQWWFFMNLPVPHFPPPRHWGHSSLLSRE